MRLLHPRLWWILCVAAVVLMAFSASIIISGTQAKSKRGMLFEIPGMLILLVPLLFFLLAKEARLDGTSLENRIIQNDHGVFLNTLPSVGIPDGSGSSDMSFSQVLRDPKKYENQDVEIVCQSYVHDQLPENTVMCYRYLITCCAADALPAFFFLEHPEKLEIKNNEWVKVKGPLSITHYDNMEFPTVNIDAVQYVAEPAFPWAI